MTNTLKEGDTVSIDSLGNMYHGSKGTVNRASTPWVSVKVTEVPEGSSVAEYLGMSLSFHEDDLLYDGPQLIQFAEIEKGMRIRVTTSSHPDHKRVIEGIANDRSSYSVWYDERSNFLVSSSATQDLVSIELLEKVKSFDAKAATVGTVLKVVVADWIDVLLKVGEDTWTNVSVFEDEYAEYTSKDIEPEFLRDAKSYSVIYKGDSE